LNPLWQLVLARLKEFFREPSALFWTFGFPALLALALGVAFQGGSRPVPVVVMSGPHAAERAAMLARDARFRVVEGGDEVVARAMRDGDAVLAVGGDVPVTYLYDAAHPEAEAARARADDLIQRAAGRTDPVPSRDEEVSAPGARYIEFLVPGLLGMNIMSSSLWGIGWVVVEARKRKLLKRIMATPLKRSHFLLSMIIARLVFLLAEAGVIVLFAWLVFDVRVLGSLAALASLSVVGAMAFAGLAFLASSRTSSTETVSGLMNLVMLPMFVFSGVFFSASRFPDWMQAPIRALPLTLLNDGLRQVMNQGAGLLDVLAPVGILAAWTVVTLVVAVRIFKWT
jgi:ABC-type multidrug transport system permease subunit